jgi:aspartate/methionine/tyrosine aminotransferase
MTEAVEPFHAITLSRLAHRLKAEGRSILHMEFGQPSTGAPAAAIRAAHHILDSDPMGYWESEPLRVRIAALYRERHGLTIDPERIILTAGASPALVLALLLRFERGARVATARPGYVAYRNSLKALGFRPVEIGCGPAERYQMTAAALAALDPAPAGVILASPANPTGTVIAADELDAIAGLCRARGIAIISDEIYHGLVYGAPARTMLDGAPDAIIINSFSKYWSMAGWRLGWLVVPADLVA